MLTAVFGNLRIQAFTGGNPDKTALAIGVALMMASGLAVVAIGFLMYRVLKPFNQKLAWWYPVMRLVEFTVSAVCGIYVLTQLQAVPNAMLWIYIPTAIGGLVFTYLLLTSRIVPRLVAILGLVGYAALLLDVPLRLAGAISLNGGMDATLLGIGGLFEFLVLPAYLITKGFKIAK
jgi:hypothetical protein